MKITAEHERAMLSLPYDGSWKLEAQLVGLTGLKHRTRIIYRELIRAGWCKQGAVAAQRGIAATSAPERVRMYHCPVELRKAYCAALKEQGDV